MKKLLFLSALCLGAISYQAQNKTEFKLSKKNYSGWKVFIVIGNPFLESEYIINDNMITIKCEDSYIHLTKKVVMAFKIIAQLYTITEGILRCGDDLVFNEIKLNKFLNKKDKTNYMGVVACRNKKIQKVTEMFMVDYFNKNPNDLLEKLNGINYTLEETIWNSVYCINFCESSFFVNDVI